MSRLIDVDELAEDFRQTNECMGDMPWELFDILAHLKDAPTVEAMEITHARWEYDQDGFYKCSNCWGLAKVDEDWRGEPAWGFCPRCGAKMYEED